VSAKSEFTVENAYAYNRSGPVRWILSHVWRYKFLLLLTITLYLVAWFSFSGSHYLVGVAAGAGRAALWG